MGQSNTKTRILGIDPGTGILGFGVIDTARNGQSTLVDGGVIRTPIKQPDSERLLTIYDELKDVIESTKPSVMAVEKIFFSQNITTAISVSQARGVVLLLGQQYQLELHEFTPQKIKMALVGYGKADKKQVQEMVRLTLGLKEVPKPDDCADAIAAALCCGQSMRQ